MMQEVRNWYEMAAMDLGVARHLDRTYYPKPLEILKKNRLMIVNEVFGFLGLFF